MNMGQDVLWHAVRGDKIAKIYSIEGTMLYVLDDNGIHWIASKHDCILLGELDANKI